MNIDKWKDCDFVDECKDELDQSVLGILWCFILFLFLFFILLLFIFLSLLSPLYSLSSLSSLSTPSSFVSLFLLPFFLFLLFLFFLFLFFLFLSSSSSFSSSSFSSSFFLPPLLFIPSLPSCPSSFSFVSISSSWWPLWVSRPRGCLQRLQLPHRAFITNIAETTILQSASFTTSNSFETAI